MSPSEIPPLAPLPLAIEALLQAEREAPAPAPAVAARVFRRLGNTLGWPATGAAGSLLSSAKLYVIAALLAAGVAGTLARVRVRSTPTPASMPAAPLASAVAEQASPAPLEPLRPIAAPAPALTPAPAATRSPGRRDDSLGAESAILIAARRSLEAGDAPAAVARLRTHLRRWPRGALEQEREILLIRTLAVQGDDAAAGARARRFLQRFPDSTLAEVARQHAPAE